MGVEDPGGYLDNKQSNKERLKTLSMQLLMKEFM